MQSWAFTSLIRSWTITQTPPNWQEITKYVTSADMSCGRGFIESKPNRRPICLLLLTFPSLSRTSHFGNSSLELYFEPWNSWSQLFDGHRDKNCWLICLNWLAFFLLLLLLCFQNARLLFAVKRRKEIRWNSPRTRCRRFQTDAVARLRIQTIGKCWQP